MKLVMLAAILLCEEGARAVSVHVINFAPPAGIQKYSFYPQGGNFFGDLFPTNFVDVDTRSGFLAYNGSDYTYDGHTGIDTEITNFTAQDIGVPIFAALDGTVIATHDGEFDKNTMLNSLPPEYVEIDHGNGQTTTYIHLKKDSVAVVVGQQVTAGQQIGLTASSGTAPLRICIFNQRSMARFSSLLPAPPVRVHRLGVTAALPHRRLPAAIRILPTKTSPPGRAALRHDA
jgi:hypothetical protein